METDLVRCLNETLRRATATEKTRRKALTWLRKAIEALESRNWLLLLELARDQRVREVVDAAVLPSEDIESLRSQSRSHTVDAQIGFFRQVQCLCQAGGLVPSEIGSSNTELRIRGMLAIRLNAQRGSIDLKTLARQKRLAALSPKQAYDVAAGWWRTIWERPFDGQSFLSRLHRAYARRAQQGQEVLLGDVQRYLWEDMQPRSFWERYDLDLAKQYTTDEFSADLSHLLSSGVDRTDSNLRLHLSPHGGGIPVFDARGACSTYKFIRFDPG